MTTITAPQTPLAAKRPSFAASRASQRSPFTEVQEQARQRTLMILATATGILSVTVAASAAVVLGLSA
ncbi:hypothetical protein [Curtobacterium sp. MCBD17_023]|uniref:hypothetical protein n=1 Tax=Curtobacterium sp. MCBD17_023 TaxID=2175657 RepID=UPI000D942D3F|nr:hypothetical protein [Curtobacterium sp. MCBD17_023]PYY46224.1 hypothetical protein DEI84_12910 [Curtobacterium sp. MCBD17_023]